MTQKTVFILFAVFLLTLFLSACHPGRWGPGCENYARFETQQTRPHLSGSMIAGDVNSQTAGRL